MIQNVGLEKKCLIGQLHTLKRNLLGTLKQRNAASCFLKKNKVAYFDEFLNSKELGPLRGSGVLKKGKKRVENYSLCTFPFPYQMKKLKH